MNYDRFCFFKSKPNEEIFDLEFWYVSCIVEIKVLHLLHQSTVLNINDIITSRLLIPYRNTVHILFHTAL